MTNILNKMRTFLSPDGAEGGGGGGGDAEPLQPGQELLDSDKSGIPGVETSSNEPSGERSEPTEKGEAAESKEDVASGLTKADIEQILQNVLPAATAAQQPRYAPQAQPQITQEQYDQMFSVYKPDANLITLLRSEDPNIALKALTQLRDGFIRQAMTMAEYRMQQYRDQVLNNYVMPLNGYVSEQRATAFRDDFFKSYPDLEPYETIVDAVAAKLEREGTMQGQPRAAIMKRFADDANSVIKSLLAKKGANGASNGGGRRMSTLTGGGQGGQSRPSGKAAAGKAAGPAGIEVFD